MKHIDELARSGVWKLLSSFCPDDYTFFDLDELTRWYRENAVGEYSEFKMKVDYINPYSEFKMIILCGFKLETDAEWIARLKRIDSSIDDQIKSALANYTQFLSDGTSIRQNKIKSKIKELEIMKIETLLKILGIIIIIKYYYFWL